MDAQNLHQRDGKSSQGVMTAELGPERSEVLARQRVPSSVISLYKCPEARERSFIQMSSIHLLVHSPIHSTITLPAPTMCQAPCKVLGLATTVNQAHSVSTPKHLHAGGTGPFRSLNEIFTCKGTWGRDSGLSSLRVLGPHSPPFSCQAWQQAAKPSCADRLWGGHQFVVGASADV